MPELSKTTSLSDTELTKEELVEVFGGDDGTTPVSARLISNPAGTNDYYADTRDADGKLVIGRKLDYAG